MTHESAPKCREWIIRNPAFLDQRWDRDLAQCIWITLLVFWLHFMRQGLKGRSQDPNHQEIARMFPSMGMKKGWFFCKAFSKFINFIGPWHKGGLKPDSFHFIFLLVHVQRLLQILYVVSHRLLKIKRLPIMSCVSPGYCDLQLQVCKNTQTNFRRKSWESSPMKTILPSKNHYFQI